VQYDLIQRDMLKFRHRSFSVRRRECSNTENGIPTNCPRRNPLDCQAPLKCALALAFAPGSGGKFQP
jgi:hypothetical protein